jgi:hypothetical protein
MAAGRDMQDPAFRRRYRLDAARRHRSTTRRRLPRPDPVRSCTSAPSTGAPRRVPAPRSTRRRQSKSKGASSLLLACNTLDPGSMPCRE